MSEVAALYRSRPRSRLLRASMVAWLMLVGLAWGSDSFHFSSLGSEGARDNLERFLGEIRPYPLQDQSWSWQVAWQWLVEQTGGRAAAAVLDTLALSLAAILLAALVALGASLLAARSLMEPQPWLPGPRPAVAARRLAFAGVFAGTRLLLVVLRAIPEYLWAFLLLILLGPGALPAVVALALHNAGILGRLFAEVSEDVAPGPAQALRALGASRLSVAIHGIWPQAQNRFLLFFFYRWETCVREATVLGLLGFGGLGYYVLQAQAAIRWDEMLLWTLLGSALVIVGDFVSSWARARIRDAV